VIESSATLILNEGTLSGGTALTLDFARRFGKPYILVQLDEERLEDALSRVGQWLSECETEVLNVAGPGERKRPGIHGRALRRRACLPLRNRAFSGVERIPRSKPHHSEAGAPLGASDREQTDAQRRERRRRF